MTGWKLNHASKRGTRSQWRGDKLDSFESPGIRYIVWWLTTKELTKCRILITSFASKYTKAAKVSSLDYTQMNSNRVVLNDKWSKSIISRNHIVMEVKIMGVSIYVSFIQRHLFLSFKKIHANMMDDKNTEINEFDGPILGQIRDQEISEVKTNTLVAVFK